MTSLLAEASTARVERLLRNEAGDAKPERWSPMVATGARVAMGAVAVLFLLGRIIVGSNELLEHLVN